MSPGTRRQMTGRGMWPSTACKSALTPGLAMAMAFVGLSGNSAAEPDNEAAVTQRHREIVGAFASAISC